MSVSGLLKTVFYGVCTLMLVDAVANAAFTYLSEKKKRAKIKADAEKNKLAIQRTETVMMQRLQDGEYDRKSFVAIMDDFDSELAYQNIVVRMED